MSDSNMQISCWYRSRKSTYIWCNLAWRF